MRVIFKKQNIFHLLFWLMCFVFILLEMQYYINKKGWLFSMLPMFIHLALMAVLVYGNTLILIPHLLQKRKLALYILGIVILILGNALLRSMISSYFDGLVWTGEHMTLQSYFKWNFFFAIWFILISAMLFFTQKWTEQRQQVKNIEINQLQTELKYLRAQLNPHFLFNGLNTIYGNIDMANQKARDILVQFSDLLRYNLYEADTDWVELEKEAIYLQNYV
ncbi:MAG TPA: histidine kinase, partial [Chitinophagaceae bacterium]|nr:histidine kinase [Chitinophagaceae bacterium]